MIYCLYNLKEKSLNLYNIAVKKKNLSLNNTFGFKSNGYREGLCYY